MSGNLSGWRGFYVRWFEMEREKPGAKLVAIRPDWLYIPRPIVQKLSLKRRHSMRNLLARLLFYLIGLLLLDGYIGYLHYGTAPVGAFDAN